MSLIIRIYLLVKIFFVIFYLLILILDFFLNIIIQIKYRINVLGFAKI